MKLLTYFYKRLAFFFKKKINIDNEKLNYRNLDELFTYYGTDKAKKVRTQYNKNSDLFIGHGYSKFYENHFAFLKNSNFNLLEIGTWFGASTASFCKYFPNAKIFGIDKNFKFKYKSKNISFIQCDIRTKIGLKKLSNKIYGKKFKIIIDDGSHILTHIIKNIIFFTNYIEQGGFFVIEDFNLPKNHDNLNDAENKEIYIDEILKNIKQKKYFKSDILSKSKQKYLFETIENIYVYKGNSKDSDIAFLKIK
tara:strand:+ start:1636 stop:2388 length:753 start_codon:yes stop_codon:yes gene_type:complete